MAALYSALPSQAGVVCKTVVSGGLAGTEARAIQSWISTVSSQYGAMWSNYEVARDKTIKSIVDPLPLRQVYARPCLVSPNQVTVPSKKIPTP